ncbi:MAG: efflux RND transporter periplasmic adaptor subunit [Gammaproteobacteria bacterium]|jgi:RND family efflux transporter MFP subunit
MLKKLVPVVIVLAAIGIAFALIANRRTLQPAQPQPVPTAVRILTVEPGPVQLRVHAQGTVSPRTETQLVPEVSGNVVWISPNLIPGGYFEAGETLLRIDGRDYMANLRRAEASLARAQADDELARFELTRAEELINRQLISRSDYEERVRSARVADTAVADAELVVQTARNELDRTIMTAPFAGLVRSEQVDIGQFINRGNSIAEVYATDALEVRLPIADQQLAYLNVPLEQRGEMPPDFAPSVALTAEYAGKTHTWTGYLARTEAQIDPGSRMVYAIARVRADAADQVASPPVGLFVQAEIEGIAEDNIVVLPRSALRDANQVLVVDTENRLHFRKVEILRVYRDEVYVSAGLEMGERVSISPLQTVVEGMRVQPIDPNT